MLSDTADRADYADYAAAIIERVGGGALDPRAKPGHKTGQSPDTTKPALGGLRKCLSALDICGCGGRI